MEVELTRDQKALIQQAIESGRISRPEDAVQSALAMWEEREYRRMEIIAAVKNAQTAIARGEGRTISNREETIALADEVKKRGLARLTAEQSQH